MTTRLVRIRYLVICMALPAMLLALVVLGVSHDSISAHPLIAPGPIGDLTSTTHLTGEWSNLSGITLTWSPAPTSGLELAGYALAWDSVPSTTTSPITISIGPVTSTSATLADGLWYFHIQAADTEGNWAGAWSDLGPFEIDTQPPAEPVVTVSGGILTTTVAVDWSSEDALSGIAGYTVEYSHTALGSWQLASSGPATQTVVTLPYTGTTFLFRVSAQDEAGNAMTATRSVQVGPFQQFLPAIVKSGWNAGSGIDVDTRVDSLLACTGDWNMTLYAGTTGKGVFKSIDAGVTWSPAGSELSTITVYRLLAWPDCDTIYAGTFGQGVYLSTDGGEHWWPFGSGLPDLARFVYTLAYDPSNSSFYAGTYQGVWQLVPGSPNWSQMGLESESVLGLAIDARTPRTLYAATYDHGVYASTDNGAHWQSLGIQGRIDAIALDPDSPSTLLIAGPSGISRTTDAGNTWTLVLPGAQAYWVARDAASNEYLAGLADQGPRKSQDGIAWVPLGASLSGSSNSVLMLVANEQFYYAATKDRVWRYPR